MSRRKKAPVFVSPAWHQTLKTKFLQAAFGNCLEAANLLVTDVYEQRMTTRDWAERFNVAGTWIEQWAAEVLEFWHDHPVIFPRLPPPHVEETEADSFSFVIANARPFFKFSLGVLAGGSFPDDADEDDWGRFKQQQHARLEAALERYRLMAVQAGTSLEIKIPNDLDLKLQVAAIYIFRGMSIDELAEMKEIARDRTRVYRWVAEILSLVDIPMRTAGSKPKLGDWCLVPYSAKLGRAERKRPRGSVHFHKMDRSCGLPPNRGRPMPE